MIYEERRKRILVSHHKNLDSLWFYVFDVFFIVDAFLKD